MRNITSLVASSGYLVLSTFNEATRFSVGNVEFPNYPVTAAKMQDVLPALDFKILILKHGPSKKHLGGTLSLLAQRNN